MHVDIAGLDLSKRCMIMDIKKLLNEFDFTSLLDFYKFTWIFEVYLNFIRLLEIYKAISLLQV